MYADKDSQRIELFIWFVIFLNPLCFAGTMPWFAIGTLRISATPVCFLKIGSWNSGVANPGRDYWTPGFPTTITTTPVQGPISSCILANARIRFFKRQRDTSPFLGPIHLAPGLDPELKAPVEGSARPYPDSLLP